MLAWSFSEREDNGVMRGVRWNLTWEAKHPLPLCQAPGDKTASESWETTAGMWGSVARGSP